MYGRLGGNMICLVVGSKTSQPLPSLGSAAVVEAEAEATDASASDLATFCLFAAPSPSPSSAPPSRASLTALMVAGEVRQQPPTAQPPPPATPLVATWTHLLAWEAKSRGVLHPVPGVHCRLIHFSPELGYATTIRPVACACVRSAAIRPGRCSGGVQFTPTPTTRRPTVPVSASRAVRRARTLSRVVPSQRWRSSRQLKLSQALGAPGGSLWRLRT